MIKYFPDTKFSGERLRVELDLSNYVKKQLKNETSAHTSKFGRNADLANFKSNLDKFDIDKLKNVPSNLKNLKSKVYILDIDKLLSGKLNDVVKKDVYNAKVENIEDIT